MQQGALKCGREGEAVGAK